MGILKDLSELVKEQVISSETADKIQSYYKSKEGKSNNRLFIVFGVLGSILIGLGIILIMAHNWDNFSRPVKTFLALFPMLIGQYLCAYTLIRKQDSRTWRESSAAFLFFSVGACISLISQIYNIPGNLSSFLMVWMILCLPLIYIMKSSIVSLLYLAGITFYACETNYWTRESGKTYYYWLLLLLALPHYYLLFKEKPSGNFTSFHNWLVPLSVVIALGTLTNEFGEVMFIAYMSLFGLLYAIGHSKIFNGQNLMNNGYRVISAIGTLVMLLILSFDWFWEELRKTDYQFSDLISSNEFVTSVLITMLALGLLYFTMKNKMLNDLKPLSIVFIIFIFTFFIGLGSPISILIINIITVAIGVLTIREGAHSDHLGILNYGLLIITALVICRFFDTDLSFVLRGVLFVLVGVGFFVTNYRMLQKRKANG